MIKVTVMYRHTEGAKFNHDYYRDSHMPLVKSKLGDACLRYEIDQGLAGGAPGSAPVYVAMGHMYCTSIEAFQATMAQHGAEIFGDIPNYTDLKPEVQISQVVV